MINYTGWQWLLIDAANNYNLNLDRELFETRIAWVENNLDNLEDLAGLGTTVVEPWKEQPLFIKAVQAIRKAQQGKPTGHLVAVDATCSGIQIMSALTRCVAGATATGLVDPNRRADAYTQLTQDMSRMLDNDVGVVRSDAKDALMTSFYGSRAKPKEIFGEGTVELETFYKAAKRIAPGAWELLQQLLGSWQPYALQHCWQLPNGFEVKIKVMEKISKRIEVDELDHTTFTFEYKDNIGSKTGLSNAANVTHSVDAFVVHMMHQRCNYNEDVVNKALHILEYTGQLPTQIKNTNIEYYRKLYGSHKIAVPDVLKYLSLSNVSFLTSQHKAHLLRIIKDMLRHKPFPIVTNHDAFSSHANNVNHVRYHYKEILADLAESTVLDSILSDIHGFPGTYNKMGNRLSSLIRNSNYALT